MTNHIEVNLPEWALPAIVNNDYTGLNDEDEAQVRKFVAEHGDVFECYSYTTFFSAFPAFGLATDCVLAKFPVRP